MSNLEDRLSSLEHSRTAFKAVVSVLSILGIGLAAYANFLRSELKTLERAVPEAVAAVNEAEENALVKIKAEEQEFLSRVKTTAESRAAEAAQRLLAVKQFPLDVKSGAQYPDHGKLLVSQETNGRVTLSGLFGHVQLPPDNKKVVIAKLPKGICPDESQIFDVAVHPVGTARLDISKNGELVLNHVSKLSTETWDVGRRGTSWLSLDGVSFFGAEQC
ncbi:MAG: hypothetical protein AAGF55_07380 [Pseudomonadota bacterium]